MADVNKTVDIQVKADMKQLLNEFKKMPGMTAKEAKKMVSMLEREFKAAERAAKKAAAANAAAMKKVGDTAKRSAKEIRQMKRSSQEMGGALQATGDIIGEIDPALGGMVATLSIAGTAVRDLGKAFLTGNPYILAAVAAAAAAAAAYSMLTASSREAEKRQENLAKATEELNEKLDIQRQIAEDVVSAHRESTLELEVFTGQISELDAQIIRARDEAADTLKKQLEQQDEIIKAAKEDLDIVKRAAKSRASLTEEEYKRLELLVQTSKYQDVQTSLSLQQGGFLIKSVKHQRELIDKINTELLLKERIKKANAETLQNREELLQLQDELRKEQEAEARREEQQAEQEAKAAAAKAKADAEKAKADAEAKAKAEEEKQRLLKNTAEIQKSGDMARKEAEAQSIRNERALISLYDTNLERLDATANLDKKLIQQSIDSLQQQQSQNIILAETEEQIKEAKEANLALDSQIAELKEQAHLVEMKHSKEREKALEDERKKRLQLVSSIVTQSTDGANAVATIIKNVSGENKKAAMLAFRVNQASAISNIIMTTAQKVMEVAPNPFAIAGVSALGALQAGAVASQPPPEFHMGGVIDKGEDTRNITVLTGEAVLDRRTVNRLGGDSGIAALQRGDMPTSPQVIVMNPFKHFDRYAKASSKRGGVMKNFSNTRASGGY